MSLILYIVLIALQMADALTTWRALARGGREANPAIAWLMTRIGVRAALAVKGLVVVAIGAVLLSMGGIAAMASLIVLVGVYVLVVVHNWQVLR